MNNMEIEKIPNYSCATKRDAAVLDKLNEVIAQVNLLYEGVNKLIGLMVTIGILEESEKKN